MQRVQPGIISPHWRIRRYTDFCPVSAEQLYGRQTTVREMNQLLIGMDSNALREFLNLKGADSEKLCQERATEQEYYQGKEALAVFHAFEKAYGNIENGDSHRYEKALKEGLCGEPDTGKESSTYNRHYVWDFRGNAFSWVYEAKRSCE